MAIRDRLGHLTPQDEKVLRAVGEHQGALASRDLKARCADGLEQGADTWAARKRELTKESSSRIVTEREAKAGTQRIQHRSGCAQYAAVGPKLTHAHW
ncbi:hypothetical protein [Streptomyces sp. NPDC005181]|uniref:hypothetical protein n=1 Tax=Streptomyces sp. NPDC005181 TaxID=3156869 RepID=UPI0033A8C2B4